MSCVSRPKKQGAICLDENREAVCQAEDADGKCVNFVMPYAKTDGMLMFDPAEYKARIKRAQEQ